MTSYDKLKPHELAEALELILAVPGGSRPAARPLVTAFCDYLQAGNLRWEGWRCGLPTNPTALFLAVLLPGHTVLLFIPQPGEHGINPAAQLDLSRAALADLAKLNLHYGQALLEPEALARRELVRQAGFELLAPLLYLERGVAYPWVEPPVLGGLSWLNYGEGTRAEFARTILASYQDSLDCPELTGLRPIEDILASHEAAGHFDPALWELARVDGQAAGCLLLARHERISSVELVYMGVVPEWRRRGIGELLIRRAVEQSRGVRARRLSVVVDDRNERAKRVYDRFGVALLTRREAHWYRWTAEPVVGAAR